MIEEEDRIMDETKTKELPKGNNEKELPTEYDKRWLVLLGAFVIVSTYGYILCSRHWNTEITEFIDMSSRFEIYIQIVISMLLIICYLIAPLSSLLIKLFGLQIVTIVGSTLAGTSMLIFYLLYHNHESMLFSVNISISVAIGIGLGLMYLSAITSVITYFKKFRPLAIGFVVCGLSEINIFYKIRENEYGFDSKVEIIVLIVIIFLCSLCGFIFRPIKVTKKTQNDTENSQVINNVNTTLETKNISKRFKEWISDMISLFKNPVFIFFVVIWTFFSIAQRMSYNYILIKLSEITHDFEYLLYTIVLSGLFGRILFGFIFSIPRLTQHRNKIFSLSILVTGIVSAIIIPFNNVNVYTICLIVIFVLTSGSIGMFPVIVADLMTPKLFSNAYSLLLFFSGIAMIFEHNIIYLVDNNHVEISLNIFGSIISLCGLLLFTIPTLHAKQEKHRVNSVYLQRL